MSGWGPISESPLLQTHTHTHLLHSLGAVVPPLPWVSGVNGSVETLPRVQSDGVLVPWTHHTQTAM